MKNIFLGFVTFILAFSFAKALQAQFNSYNSDIIQQPIVVELFTSQSCSSCPPADRFLSELNENPNVIALGFHVTYWDHLSWKDTVSREFATQRQRAYSRTRNSRRVYTPQMVVNGKAEFVGSRRGDFVKATRSAQPIQNATLVVERDNLVLSLPEVEAGQYTLWLYGIGKDFDQAIGRGENHGRNVHYSNPVLTQENVGSWNGGEKALSLNPGNSDDIDHYIILAQKQNGYGQIVAAGKSKN